MQASPSATKSGQESPMACYLGIAACMPEDGTTNANASSFSRQDMTEGAGHAHKTGSAYIGMHSVAGA